MIHIGFHRRVSRTIGGIDPVTREALEVLGSIVRDGRATRGLSQRALASRVGLSQSTVSRFERGRAEGLRAAWIARLLAALDGPVQALPDDRPIVERCHGFLHLRRAFSYREGTQRRQARVAQRRADFAAWAASKRTLKPGR